ncbi:MAG TPA: glycosyltransferase 87 family protein, partial [Gemmataceae bacterium]|nr:glycosyltransferase 87 family protein [Gemmataceae bacterium]
GYYYLQKNADIRGGILWGLLAYKPSWAVTYFVMLLVSRRWKAALAMGACGMAQILLTLPFVGVHSWLEWRQVLAEGAKGYGIHENWVNVARDLISYPRRAWTDWNAPPLERDLFKSRLAAYVLIGVALEVTARLAAMRGHRAKHWTYAAGAFLLLGFWMCCYRITYYDTIVATLPIAILLMVPSHVFVPYFFRRTPLAWSMKQQTREAGLTLPERNYGNVCNPLIVYMLPLILWHPWTGVFVDTVGKAIAWPLGLDPGTFDDLMVMLPDGWEWSLYFNQPLIVPFYAVCWLWAGWMWLREK